MRAIDVVYEHGVFRPLDKVDLAEHTKGRVILVPNVQEMEELLRAQKEALSEIVGMGESGQQQISREHDEHLYLKR